MHVSVVMLTFFPGDSWLNMQSYCCWLHKNEPSKLIHYVSLKKMLLNIWGKKNWNFPFKMTWKRMTEHTRSHCPSCLQLIGKSQPNCRKRGPERLTFECGTRLLAAWVKGNHVCGRSSADTCKTSSEYSHIFVFLPCILDYFGSFKKSV